MGSQARNGKLATTGGHTAGSGGTVCDNQRIPPKRARRVLVKVHRRSGGSKHFDGGVGNQEAGNTHAATHARVDRRKMARMRKVQSHGPRSIAIPQCVLIKRRKLNISPRTMSRGDPGTEPLGRSAIVPPTSMGR